MAAVMLGGVFVGFALHPGFVFGFANHFLAFAELDSVFDGEALGAIGNEHHVRAILEGAFVTRKVIAWGGFERDGWDF